MALCGTTSHSSSWLCHLRVLGKASQPVDLELSQGRVCHLARSNLQLPSTSISTTATTARAGFAKQPLVPCLELGPQVGTARKAKEPLLSDEKRLCEGILVVTNETHL